MKKTEIQTVMEKVYSVQIVLRDGQRLLKAFSVNAEPKLKEAMNVQLSALKTATSDLKKIHTSLWKIEKQNR